MNKVYNTDSIVSISKLIQLINKSEKIFLYARLGTKDNFVHEYVEVTKEQALSFIKQSKENAEYFQEKPIKRTYVGYDNKTLHIG